MASVSFVTVQAGMSAGFRVWSYPIVLGIALLKTFVNITPEAPASIAFWTCVLDEHLNSPLITRKLNRTVSPDEILFFKIVKTSFQQRRKIIRNSLKVFNLSNNIKEGVIFDRRPETLSVDDFVHLTNIIANGNIST